MFRSLIVTAAIGAVGIGLAPAAVAEEVPPGPFASCSEAAEYGYYNIPSDSPHYSTDLDRDDDGVACEKKN